MSTSSFRSRGKPNTRVRLPVKQLGERFVEIWRKRTDAEAVSDERVLTLEQPERILKIQAQDL